MLDKATYFLNHEIWKIPDKPLGPFRTFFYKVCRILISVINGFSEDRCYIKASALAFYSLLSLVPVLAVAFGIAKGFGFEELLHQQVENIFHDYPEISSRVISFSYSLLKHTEGGIIAGIGAAVLIWTVFSLLANIEDALNQIWHVKALRSYSKRFSDYVTIMILGPFFFVITSSFTIYVTSQITQVTRENQLFHALSPIVALSLSLVPYILSWIFFTGLYLILPNTRVGFFYALIGGIFAGTAYLLVQWIYIKFQIGAANYGAIYGSFAALPLFFVWVQTSWVIVLLGAEIAYHAENDARAMDTHFHSGYIERKVVSKQTLAILFLTHIVENFCEGKVPPSLSSLAEEFGVPWYFAKGVADHLQAVGLAREVKTTRDGSDLYYQPGRDVSTLTLSYVIHTLNLLTQETLSVYSSSILNATLEQLHLLDQLAVESPDNIHIKDIPSLLTKKN